MGNQAPLKLFTRDDLRTQNIKQRSALSHLSYHQCFHSCVVAGSPVIGILGAFGMVYSFTKILCTYLALELPPATHS